MAGKVWLVGAGPGDRGLLTLKGLEALREAEAVVYDALVGDEVLTLIPENAKKINVGKRAGRHLMAQEEINRVLLEEARKGLRVVRLKGGDPFVFGRGGEELELLAQNGIPFEVVPGVTSAFAVPAYNGIPVTHRDYASSVHIITGHRRKDPAGGSGQEKSRVGSGYRAGNFRESESVGVYSAGDVSAGTGTTSCVSEDSEAADGGIDFEALARLGGTLVFLMGVSSLPSIMEGLLSAGVDPERPAAVLEKGTTSKQRRIIATVSTLAAEAASAGAEAPAIIIVGDVCRLADAFSWYDRASDRPLAGKKILVTRPGGMAPQTADRLRRLGAEVLEVPAIEIVPVSPNPALEACLAAWTGRADLSESPADIEPDGINCGRGSSFGPPEWLVFTSPTGVRVFMDAFMNRYDVRDLCRTKIAVIGEGSRKALLRYGIRADFMPSVYDGETLGRELARRIREDGEGTAATEPVRILIPRASIGNRALVDELEKAGDVEILDIPTYDTVYSCPGVVDLRARICGGQIDYVIFTSASTVMGFCASVQGADLSGVTAVCIGRQTAAVAEAAGMRTRVAKKATEEALVEEVIAASGKRPPLQEREKSGQ